MNRRADTMTGIAAALGIILLILDSKTALAGAQSGVELCIRTVIPSLFPFFLFSILLTTSLMGRRIPFLRPVCRLCRIPEGAESILIAGFLGGYPVGAQCVSQAYSAEQLTHADARRLLGFCNNCGPAFLFGMAAALFTEWWVPWALWGIHIFSALCVGMLIPGQAESCSVQSKATVSPVQALNQSVRIMAGVCGWVVIFRVLLSFLDRWFLWYLPVEAQVAISGLLELSNGCVALYNIGETGLRFILCAGFLGFGGLCVTMQTYSVVLSGVDRSLYFPGKVLHCCISLILASIVQGCRMPLLLIMPVIICVPLALFLRKTQKRGRNPHSIVV